MVSYENLSNGIKRTESWECTKHFKRSEKENRANNKNQNKMKWNEMNESGKNEQNNVWWWA